MASLLTDARKSPLKLFLVLGSERSFLLFSRSYHEPNVMENHHGSQGSHSGGVLEDLEVFVISHLASFDYTALCPEKKQPLPCYV